MDKQDAIDYIVEQFENDRPPSEIARLLSAEINAPYEVVLKFVNRSLEGRIALNVPPPVDPLQPTPPTEPPASGRNFSPAPTGGKDAWNIPAKAPGPAVHSGETPAGTAPSPKPPHSADLREQTADPGPAQPLASHAAFEPSPSNLPPFATISGSGASLPAAASQEIDPRLEKFIFDELSRNHKHSDIVMAVCERAALDWPAAQRMVGRVEAKNHKQISTRRNRLMIPITVIVLAAGFILLAALFPEWSLYFPMLSELTTNGVDAAIQNIPQGDVVGLRPLAAYTLLGLGLVLGGLVGLVSAFKTQYE